MTGIYSQSCVNTNTHKHSQILHDHDGTTAQSTLLFKICSSQRRPWCPPPLTVEGIMLVAGLTAAAGHWHRLLGRSWEQLLHLTLIDPVCRESCSSTCSKLANYHFKEVPRKGYPFEQNASIHTSKEEPDIGLWGGTVTTKAWKKVLSSNSYFPKPLDIRPPLYHDKGNRVVSGVNIAKQKTDFGKCLCTQLCMSGSAQCD